MDVRLPNGMLIRGIPEGTTQEQIAARLSSAGYDLAELGIQPRPQQIEEPTPEPVEDQSIFRSVADVPLQFATGVSQGVRFISDAFGADNAVSQNLRGVEDYLGSLLSAQAKNDREEVARIFQDAQDKGLGERLAAGLRALAVSPVDFIAQGLGTAVPTIAGGLAGAALRGGTLAARAATAAKVGTGIGVVGGAGLTKSTIYDEVKNELEALDLPEEVVEERARLAQEYGGENLDQILLGAGLGGLAAGTGIEKVLASRILKNAGARTTGALAATKAAAFTGAKEAVPEFIQAAQEQMAGNIALQREGFEDIPTMRGVAEAAALEGSVGFLIGAGIGGIDAAVSPQQRSRYDAARASITNEVDRERELALRLEADQAAQRFMDSLAADNARRAQGQADQVNLDAEAANARAAASNIAPPTQDEVNALATPFKGADVSGDVQFGISYGQKIARELGDYFPNFGQFSVRQGEVQGDGTYGPEGRAISLGTPTFEVIDSEGKRYGQPLQTFEQANATALSLNKEVINQNVRGAIRNSLDISPQPYDPDTTQRLFTYGYRTLNPEANTFSTVAINEAAKTTGPEYAEGLSWRQVEALPQAKDRRGRVIGYEFRPEGAAEGQPPRIIKGLTKAQEINKARSQEGKPESSVFSLQETKSALGKSFAAITKDVPIDPAIGKQGAINQIRDLIRSKNITSDIASPEINALAKNLTGKDSVQDMDYGDIRLFYKKLAPLPRFERETQLPVFEFKPYSRENFVRASKFIQTANAQGQKPTRDQIIEAAGLSKEDPKIDEKISTLQTDLSKQGVKNTPQKPVTPAREPLALPAPPGQAIDLQSLRDALRAKLKGFGLNDIQLSLERNLITPTGEIMGPESEGFFLPAMRQIFLAVDRVDPDGSLTPEQRLNALAEILDHEVIHAARLLDLWTESEWSTLEKAASRTLKPGTNQTYLQIAQQNYPDQNPVVQMEEAIAEMFRDYSAKRLKISGKPQNLLQRLAQFFERLKSALAGTGFQTYSDVFNRLQTGALGGRQRGEVRTLRATEESVAQTGRIPERLRDILRTPQGRTQYRTDAIRNMISRLSPQASPPAANFARVEAIRESRRATDPVPATIRVGDQEFPTTDSQGRLIYSGYEGPEVFGIQTAPTNQGLSNFWSRFKNSKIKDSQGRPLVYYHGTAQDITAFRPKQAGSVFVTLSPTFAEEFAFLSDSYMVGNFTDFMPDQEVLNVLNETLQSPSAFSPKVYDRVVKLRDSVANSVAGNRGIRASTIKELKEIASQGRSSRLLNAIQTRMPSSANIMPVYVNAEKPWDYQDKDDVKAVVRRARDNGADVTPSMVEEISQGNWQTIEGSEGNAPILDAIRELGYDSMYVEEAGQKNLAVFNPNQIKSAIGNNGNFDVTTPSIRESRVSTREKELPEPVIGSMSWLPGGDSFENEVMVPARSAVASGKSVTKTLRDGTEVSLVRLADPSDTAQERIIALNKSGEFVGDLGYVLIEGFQPSVFVEENFRRKGLATAMYDLAEAAGARIPPYASDSAVRTTEGDAFRKAREERRAVVSPVAPSIRESRVRNPQLDTPEFQRFFKDSKVVDESGQPLVVYHGTKRDIDVFRTFTQLRRKQIYAGDIGTWFASTPRATDYFSGVIRGTNEFGMDGVVYPAYLSIKNPKEYGSYSEFLDDVGQYKSARSFRSAVEKQGFDGLVVRDSDTDAGGLRDDWVAFAPNQIKSAVGNVGAFDITRPSIRESRRQEATPIESALDLARRNHAEYSTASEEEFFGRFWPTLLSSVRGTVAPTNSGIRTAAKRAIRDMDQWLKDNPKFRDYYNNDMSATKQVLESAYGPLSDEEFLYYRIANGLTSPATKLPSNVGDALLIFDLWKRDGNLDQIKMGRSDKGNVVIQESPISISGTTGANKARTLKIIDRLTQEKGSLTNAIEFLKEGVPLQDLHAFNREMGYKGYVSDIGAIQDLVEMATGQRDLIPRMFIFGKKVGAYTLNMAGDSRYNTIDVWESRFIRSYFDGLFSERTGLPEVASEDKLFQDFTKLFKEEYEKLTNQQWDNSALQAMRWFYIINAARQAGYRGASTNETISEYTRRGIESPRTSGPYRRRKGDAETGAAGPVIRESRVGPQRPGDRGGRDQGRAIAPLEGSPNVQGGGPIPEIVSVAERYAAANGIPYERQSTYVDVDPDRAKRIADAFEAMQNNPTDPEVAAAYQDLIRQTRAQYDALVDDGYTFTFFDGDTDPYASNPWNAMRDLRNNKRMAVFGTYAGYGTKGITDSDLENNPLLEDTGLRWPDQNGVEQMVTANDLFRAVHDAFGHGIEGAGFRARGEENAWQAHARLFTGPALAALTTETRGQNSWLNYGPYGERNRTAKTEDTVFAENKIGLLPEWTWQEGIERVPAPVIREARRAPPPVTAAPQQPGPAVDTDTTGAAEALNEGQPVNSMGVAIGPVIGDTEPDGTVDISRARIAPITRRLVSQLIQSAPDKLRAGFGLDDLANRIENYYDGYAAKLGIVNNLIRNAYRNTRLGGRDAAMETFERYMRARENKKPNEAMAILNNASESERQLIDAWTQISNETGNINKNVRTPDGEPMKVYDAKLNDGKGGWRPIGTVIAFFPRTLRREVMEVMKNPDLDPELWQSLLDSLVQSGREDIKNPADAEKYLLREWFSDEIKNDYFAGVEKARTEPLPEIFYDYSWDAATRYLNKWARRTSQIENFGQELGQFKKEWFGANLPKIRDQETQNYVNTIRERIYEIEPFDTLSNMANWLNSLATATQLGNPISASLNLFGGTIANIQEFGIRAVAKSYLDLLTDWRKIQEEGTSLGILNKDFMNILRDHVEMDADKYFSKEQRISQSLARFANTALTFGGFNAAENVVRSSAMLAARARLNTFLKKVNDSPDSANVKKFNAWAKRENLNVEALILENGSGRETEKYMRRAVNIPQGSYQIDMTPVFIDTTAGRFFFKYQKFGTQINRFFYNHFLKPILTEEGRRGRNILRALGFVGTAIVGGGAILAIREAFGYGDPGPDLDELDEALKNEDTARAWALILSRSMENIMAAGSFGFFANYAQFAKDWQDQQRVKNPMSPPGLASVDAVIDVFNRLRDQKTITARDLDEIAETTMSFYRANKRIGLAVMDEMGSDAKEVERFAAFRDLREVREYGRRFSDEMGIEFKRSTAPGSPIRTEMTPVNKAITDALHVGDAAAARIIMREAIMGVPPKERQRVRQSIQSSIRNRQPLQIGGNAPSKEERILFMRWAKQNLPKEKVDLILRADREYRRAAARIGMGIS